MSDLNKGLMYIIVMIVFACSVGCYISQDKPTDRQMQELIVKAVLVGEIVNVTFTTFKITNSFFKKGSDGTDRYCIEVTYNINYGRPDWGHSTTGNFPRDADKWSFMKKGDIWYGIFGWN
jgi:hypothetical protein